MGAVDERAAGPASSTGRDGFGWAALAFTSATVVVCLLCATMVWLLPGCPGRLGAPALPLPLWVVDLGTALVLAGLGHVAPQRLARAGGVCVASCHRDAGLRDAGGSPEHRGGDVLTAGGVRASAEAHGEPSGAASGRASSRPRRLRGSGEAPR
jgi:hypothetical protein